MSIKTYFKDRLLPADNAFISTPKSGRTWVRCLINHYYYLLYPLSVTSRNHLYTNKIPLIHYDHANFSRRTLHPVHVKKRVDTLYRRYNSNIVLFRNPRDVLNSYYHHVVYGRHYPPYQDEIWKDMTISRFIKSKHGLERIITHMTAISENIKPERTLVIYYEKLKENPEKELSVIVNYLGSNTIDENIIKESVKYNSIENMRKREKKGTSEEFQISSRHRGKNDDDRGLKARKGMVGGYKETITDKDDLAYVEEKCRLMKGALERYLEN